MLNLSSKRRLLPYILFCFLFAVCNLAIIKQTPTTLTQDPPIPKSENSGTPENGRILNLENVGCLLSHDDVDNLLTSGNIKGYLDYDQFWAIYEVVRRKYGKVIGERIRFGHTINNNPIEGFYMGDGIKDDEKLYSEKNVIFITGLHHSREPLTVTMVVYLMLAILKEWGKCGVETELVAAQWNEFFRVNMILFVPMVNIDSFKFIQNNWRGPMSEKVLMVRKNRNIDPSCDIFSGGVDLNRNYDFKWGLDNEGSSGNPCAEDYRGTEPFSETETQTIRNLVNARPNIVTGVNMHTYGNAWIYPFNFVSDAQNVELRKVKPKFYRFFNNFVTEMRQKNLRADFGNSMGTINYTTNGEAGDWLIGEKNIMNLDVELGDLDHNSDKFYPLASMIPNICRYNYQIFQQFFFKHNIQLLLQSVSRNIKKGTVDFLIYNRSVSSLRDFQVEIIPEYSPTPLLMKKIGQSAGPVKNLKPKCGRVSSPVIAFGQSSMMGVVYGDRKLETGDRDESKTAPALKDIKSGASSADITNAKDSIKSQSGEDPVARILPESKQKIPKSSGPVTAPQILYKIASSLKESTSSLDNAISDKFSGTIQGFSFLRIRFKFTERKEDVLRLQRFRMITTFNTGSTKEYIFYTMSTQTQKSGQV